MDTQNEKKKVLNPYVSVDCVLLGINDDKLTVLLFEMDDESGNAIGYKLPGSLIYMDEDLDDAAYRVLGDSTGLKRVQLKQFHCFGSISRTSNPIDVKWLEATSKVEIGRLITVGYVALCKKGRMSKSMEKSNGIHWFPIDQLPRLPFDHKEIVEAAVREIRDWVEKVPAIVFDYLPTKFTALQLRHTYEVIYNREMDVRNFHKKMNSLDYVVPTEDMQDGVAHRAARYYRFDKVKYNHQRSKFNKI